MLGYSKGMIFEKLLLSACGRKLILIHSQRCFLVTCLIAWTQQFLPINLSICRQRLLVFGGGAVGFAAIQLGVAFGCHVTASCVGQTKDRILAAGAEQAVDYLTEVRIVSVYFSADPK